MKNEKNDKIYERYQRTIQTAICEAVRLTLDQDEDVHVEIFMNKNGAVNVSDLLTSNSSIFKDSIVSILDVSGWEENIVEEEDDEDYENTNFDSEMKEVEVEEEISRDEVIKDYLYPQNE